ncbi:MAG: CxxC-x17-CxxC domain-containing protein [archaeon]
MADFDPNRKPSPRRRDSGRSRDSGRGGYGDRPRRDSGYGDRPRRDGGRERQRRDRAEVEMTEVTCSSCGTKCEVPFKPTSTKPVYCNDCFKKAKPTRSSNGNLDEINQKLDKIMKALKIE